MDKVSDRIFAFEGNGIIKDFPGNYTQYKNKKEEEEEQRQKEQKKQTTQQAAVQPSGPTDKTQKRKLSYKEKLEMQQLEQEIEQLNTEKTGIETALNSGTLSNDQLLQQSQRIAKIIELLDEKEMRWLELSEI